MLDAIVGGMWIHFCWTSYQEIDLLLLSFNIFSHGIFLWSLSLKYFVFEFEC